MCNRKIVYTFGLVRYFAKYLSVSRASAFTPFGTSDFEFLSKLNFSNLCEANVATTSDSDYKE